MLRDLTIWPLLMLLSTSLGGAAKPVAVSLCDAWKMVEQPGAHRKIVVSGIYFEGLEDRSLSNPKCAETAWVDIHLRSQSNRKHLEKLLAESSRAYVSFEGELYGPPIPNADNKEFVLAWARGNRMKLVVWGIKSAGAVPKDVPY